MTRWVSRLQMNFPWRNLRLKLYRSTVYNHEFRPPNCNHIYSIQYIVWNQCIISMPHMWHHVTRHLKTLLSFNLWQTLYFLGNNWITSTFSINSTSHWLLGLHPRYPTPFGQVRKKDLILWVSLWPSTSVGYGRRYFFSKNVCGCSSSGSKRSILITGIWNIMYKYDEYGFLMNFWKFSQKGKWLDLDIL